MNNKPWRRVLLLSGVAISASAITLLAIRARAADMPSVGALTYTGYLENPDGSPVAGTKSIGISIYDAAVDGNEVCGQKPADTTPVAGRFQITLPDKCADAVQANSSLWVELEVEGALFGRTRLGAVAYAVRASTADAANSAAGDLDKRLATIEGLQHPSSAFRANVSVATQIPSKKRTAVVFDKVEFVENKDEYVAGTFIPQAAGTYSVDCQFEFAVPATAGWGAVIQLGGVDIAAADLSGDATNGMSPAAHAVLKLEKGNKVTCVAFQSSNTDQPLYLASGPGHNTFSAVRVY